jgi:hypothetical protein
MVDYKRQKGNIRHRYGSNDCGRMEKGRYGFIKEKNPSSQKRQSMKITLMMNKHN